MTPEVAEIVKRMPPPPDPIFAKGDWSKVEGELGFALPTDYKQLIDIYGAVTFCGFFWLLNPFFKHSRPEYDQPIREVLAGPGRRYMDCVLERISYPLFPEPGGLIPCAFNDNAGVWSWIPNGHPDTWSLHVYEFPEDLFPLAGATLSKFILAWTKGDLSIIPPIYPEEYFAEERIRAIRPPIIDPTTLEG